MKKNRFVRIVTACALLAAMMLFMSCAPGVSGNPTPGAPTPSTGQPTPKPHNTPAPTAAPELTPAPTPDYDWHLSVDHLENSLPEGVSLASHKTVITIPIGDGEREIGFKLDGSFIRTASTFFLSQNGRTLVIFDSANQKFLWFENGKWSRNISFQVQPKEVTDDPDYQDIYHVDPGSFIPYDDKILISYDGASWLPYFISIDMEGKLLKKYYSPDLEYAPPSRLYLDREQKVRYSVGGYPWYYDYVFSADGSYYNRTLPAFSMFSLRYGDHIPDDETDFVIQYRNGGIDYEWSIKRSEWAHRFWEDALFVDNNLNLYCVYYSEAEACKVAVKYDKNGKLIGARCLYDYDKEDGFITYAGSLFVTEDGRAYMLAVFMDRVELQEILF